MKLICKLSACAQAKKNKAAGKVCVKNEMREMLMLT